MACAFLVKLTPEITGLASIVHLAFGRSSTGTAAAAYYLSRHYGHIYASHASKPYFLALRASKVIGYASVSMDALDITADAIQLTRPPTLEEDPQHTG
jgi:hypothetical protein